MEIAAESKPTTGPVRSTERIELLDILRGLAIFGILLVNMRYYGGAGGFAWNLQYWDAPVDYAALAVTRLLAQSKFWPLLSFLFGLGFGLQMERAKRRGVPFFPLYGRRLLVLLFFGLAHTLIFFGDYLHLYAALGFLLFLFRNRSPRTLLVTGFACLFIPWGTVVTAIEELRLPQHATTQEQVTAQGQASGEDQAMEEGLRTLERGVQVYGQGTLTEIAAASARRAFGGYSFLPPPLRLLGDPFPFFFLGFYAARRRIFENIQAHLPFIRKVMWWSLGLGLVHISLLIFTSLDTNPLPVPYLTPWTFAPALGFFYACAITLLVQREAWKKRLAPLAAVGRMALSNYLFQTLVCTTIFYSYGLGLFGQVAPSAGLVLAVVIFALQIPLSVWWLQRFRFGPAEWLWRSLTYGKLQPTRVQHA